MSIVQNYRTYSLEWPGMARAAGHVLSNLSAAWCLALWGVVFPVTTSQLCYNQPAYLAYPHLSGRSTKAAMGSKMWASFLSSSELVSPVLWWSRGFGCWPFKGSLHISYIKICATLQVQVCCNSMALAMPNYAGRSLEPSRLFTKLSFVFKGLQN